MSEQLGPWRGRELGSLGRSGIHSVFYQSLLFAGLRKSEAQKLGWRHVHKDRVHLPMTNNGPSFDLPILQVHHEILAPMRGLQRQWVFPSPNKSLAKKEPPTKGSLNRIGRSAAIA